MNVGDRVSIEADDRTVEGIVLPATSSEHIVVKRAGGYNVGIDRATATVEVLEAGVHDVREPDSQSGETSTVEFDASLPTITLLSTGGTIASSVDYRTGAVSPRFDVEDVLKAIPELQGLANYRGRVISNILSENMDPGVWQTLAEAVAEEIEQGADGIVVMHGTDTMQYTASALAFMLETPVPIVFTGSQRSADRPSSDNVINAICAIETAKHDIAEVLVCMHESTNDDRCAIHRGTRVRKNHTSRRSAFETVGDAPLATIDVEDRQVTVRSGAVFCERGENELAIDTDLETDVELLKFAPGADPSRVRNCQGAAGVVIEGTGLGHVNEAWVTAIGDLIESGTPVIMTSQCLDGRVCDRVYETGRDLLDAGVIEAEDTLPETALVKLMWTVANTDDLEEQFTTSVAGECRQSTTL